MNDTQRAADKFWASVDREFQRQLSDWLIHNSPFLFEKQIIPDTFLAKLKEGNGSRPTD